ncbi:MAG: YjbQ family protein [Anaerolineales bacterium]|nr:YjbQ family protein [Anaerolineales bacterium]
MDIQTFTVSTPSQTAFVDITGKVQSALSNKGLEDGMIVVYVPHTTAGITINENADPNVAHDIIADLERLVPRKQSYYKHYEGNSASHVKASIMGASEIILIQNGRLVLGTWQGIYLCEFDGPRNRRVQVGIFTCISPSDP